MPDKHQLNRLLEEIAALLELKGDNPFKVKAYQTAAQTIAGLDMEMDELAAGWHGIKGIGKTIGQQITEFAATGRIAYRDELHSSVPPVVFELIRIPGLGPKKALAIVEQLSVGSVGELEYACHENRLKDLPGFGEKMQAKILQGFDHYKKFQGRFLLCDVLPVAEQMAVYLDAQPGVLKAEVAGSIRRRAETVKDIDIVVASAEPELAGQAAVAMPGVQNIISRGSTKISLSLATGMNLDVRIVPPEQFALCLHHFTGSKEHHVQLRALAKEQGLKINEYTLADRDGNDRSAADEEELYRLLGLSYIPPELREGRTEISLAATGRVPRLLSGADIMGVFHAHSVYSDGSNTLREMAEECRRRGWSYLGITDHSQTAVYARGLRIDAVKRQRREIDALNEELGDFVILAGIESDILADGSLDYSEDILADFDFVIASVHSHFRQSQADMTRRIQRAMENRYVTMLGHPTGRILLARPGYDVDLGAVITAAARTGTIIEINANPYRLDLDWRYCREAADQGVLLAINPDAHSLAELDHMDYGVAMARKGGLTRDDVINTRPLAEMLKLLRQKRGQ